MYTYNISQTTQPCEHPVEPYLMVVIKGQSTDFTVVWVGVLLWDILKCTVGNVGIGGHRLITLSALHLAHYFLCYLPQTHGAISGP